MDNSKESLPDEVSKVPDEEEPKLEETCKYCDEIDNGHDVFTVSGNIDDKPPEYEVGDYNKWQGQSPDHQQHQDHDHKHYHDHKHHHDHKHQHEHKHHHGHKHRKGHKHHRDLKHKREEIEHEKKHNNTGRQPNYELDPNGPKDKYNIVRIMFFVLGLIHIMPFTFFTTATEYWMYKFRDVASNSTDAKDRTYLQKNYASLSHLISSGPSTATQFLLMFLGHKLRAKTRIMLTLSLHSFVFLLHTAFVEINTDDWQVPFFCVTVLAMTIISCSMSLGSTGNMVTISQFPDQYFKTYLIGESVTSLVTAIMRIFSIISSPTTTGAALLYFITGSCIMTVSSILFYLSMHLKFFRFYTRNMKRETRKRIPRLYEFKGVLKYTWPLLLLMVISMVIPHASVGNLVVSEFSDTDSLWGTKYFVTTCTYLLPAVCSIVGRLIFYRFEYNPSIKMLYVISLTQQAVFTPLMLFVNAQPRQHLPVLFPHDWQYALIVGIHSLIEGYTSNMTMIQNLRIVPKEKLELSWLVNLFIMKIISVAVSPMSLILVNLL